MYVIFFQNKQNIAQIVWRMKMRFEKFHLYETDFSRNSLEDIVSGNSEETDSLELNSAEIFINETSYHLVGKSWNALAKPLSAHAKEHFLYIQSFSYYEMQSYYTKRDRLDSYLLKYTYEGEGELIYEGKRYLLKPGQGFVIDCRKPHEYRIVKGPWKHSELHFSGVPAAYIYEQFAADDIVCFEEPERIFQPELEKLVSLHENLLPYRELQISHQIEHMLLMILCHSDAYQNNAQKIPENLHYLTVYIDHHYMQPLTLDYMGEFSNISKYHLCRLFQKHLGYTPNEYLIQVRIENAKTLLLNTNLPANKIAPMVGIQDVNYFYRLFKSRVGVSANDFRKG